MTKVTKMGYMFTCTLSKGYFFEAEGEDVLAIDNDQNISFQCSGSSQKEVINTVLEELLKFREADYNVEEVLKKREDLVKAQNEGGIVANDC